MATEAVPASGSSPAVPSGSQSPPQAAGSGAPPPAASAAPGSGGDPPARNWEKDYADLEAKYKQYEQFGPPEKLREFQTHYSTAQQQLAAIRKDFEEGRLTYAQAQRAQEQVKQGDPFEGIESLEPKDFAQRIVGILRNEIGELTKKEITGIKEQFGTLSNNTSQQVQLAWKLLRAARENPDVDLDQIIGRATETAKYGPDQIIDLEIERAGETRRIEKAVAAAVAKREAELKAEYENKRANPPTKAMPRIMGRDKGDKAPSDLRAKRQQKFVDRLNEAFAKEA